MNNPLVSGPVATKKPKSAEDVEEDAAQKAAKLKSRLKKSYRSLKKTASQKLRNSFSSRSSSGRLLSQEDKPNSEPVDSAKGDVKAAQDAGSSASNAAGKLIATALPDAQDAKEGESATQALQAALEDEVKDVKAEVNVPDDSAIQGRSAAPEAAPEAPEAIAQPEAPEPETEGTNIVETAVTAVKGFFDKKEEPEPEPTEEEEPAKKDADEKEDEDSPIGAALAQVKGFVGAQEADMAAELEEAKADVTARVEEAKADVAAEVEAAKADVAAAVEDVKADVAADAEEAKAAVETLVQEAAPKADEEGKEAPLPVEAVVADVQEETVEGVQERSLPSAVTVSEAAVKEAVAKVEEAVTETAATVKATAEEAMKAAATDKVAESKPKTKKGGKGRLLVTVLAAGVAVAVSLARRA